MRTLSLSPASTENNSRLKSLLRDLPSPNDSPRVYRVFVKGESGDHILSMTSKEVSLYLARLSQRAQVDFTELLLEEFKKGSCSELLVSYEGRARDSLMAVLQQKAGPNASSVIHLSVAH